MPRWGSPVCVTVDDRNNALLLQCLQFGYMRSCMISIINRRRTNRMLADKHLSERLGSAERLSTLGHWVLYAEYWSYQGPFIGSRLYQICWQKVAWPSRPGQTSCCDESGLCDACLRWFAGRREFLHGRGEARGDEAAGGFWAGTLETLR